MNRFLKKQKNVFWISLPIIIGIISILIFGLSLNREKTVAESDVLYSAENNVALKSTYSHEYAYMGYEHEYAIIPVEEEIFNAFNGQYLKVSIGKGLISLQEIQSLLERYAEFF